MRKKSTQRNIPHTEATIQYCIGEKEIAYTAANSVYPFFVKIKIIILNLS